MNIKDIDFNKDYYQILGVDRSASQDDIKKAFRQASLKWHPDRHTNDSKEDQKKAEEAFKEANDAYAILSDENLKNAYDAGPQAGIDEGLMADFLRRHGFNMGGVHEPEIPPLIVDIDVSWDDICNGVIDRPISYQRYKKCNTCNGNGGEDIKSCPHCHGTGQIMNKTMQNGWVNVSSYFCPHCHGTGKIIGKPCKECNGEGHILSSETFNLSIRPQDMLADGQNLYVGDFGHQQGTNTGPLIFRIHHKLPENISIAFTWSGKSVVKDIRKIPYYDMVLGTKINVTVPSGKTLAVTVPEECEEGKMLNLPGQGFLGDDYIVIIHADYKNISKEEKELLKKIKELKS